MVINYGDRNMIVKYLQIYLRDKYGFAVTYNSNSQAYEGSFANTLEVTGVYDLSTYATLAFFMTINYPKEEFLVKWNIVSSNSYNKVNFRKELLINTVNWIKSWCTDADDFNETNYNSQSTSINYLPYSELVNDYYKNEDDFRNKLSFLIDNNLEYKDPDTFSSMILFINNNLNNVYNNYNIVQVTDRVLSYIFEEVVTEDSDDDEIFRVQKLIYPNQKISYTKLGKFDKDLVKKIEDCQSNYLDYIKDIKVTGYVDPWTELAFDRQGGHMQ